MTRKLDFIPDFESYEDVRKLMDEDFEYRFEDRKRETALGRPLYERINVQAVITQACPFKCSFCLERVNPQGAKNAFKKQLEALSRILEEHPNLRLTITGGEPGLYPKHVKKLVEMAKPTAEFISVNSTGYRDGVRDVGCAVNISDNAEVHPELDSWKDACIQTIFSNPMMTLDNVKSYMDNHPEHTQFSFRYLTDINISEYNIDILKEMKEDPDIKVGTFRVGDFFMYCTANYNGAHFRITLGDMKIQQDREYKGTYSNIIITPEGEIKLNWSNDK